MLASDRDILAAKVRLFVRMRAADYHRPMIKNLLAGFAVTALIALEAMASESPELVRAVEAALPPHVGACVMAIDHGKVVFEHAGGLADVESKTACTPATNFRIASVSKQFTATAVMLLVDRGKLSLDDPLTKFFPGFPDYGKKITVKQLLIHTSGLPEYEKLIPAGTTLQLDDLDVLHLLMDTKEPLFDAGEKFEYSNSGYTLLGLIVEAVSQKPFHEFVASEIFRPLGMNDSVLYQRGLNEVPHRAFGHEQKDGNWVRSDQSLTSAVRGDGGVYTSLHDYQKWLRGIDEQKLLSKASYEAMFSPQVLTDRHGATMATAGSSTSIAANRASITTARRTGFARACSDFPSATRRSSFSSMARSKATASRLTKLGERLADILIFNRTR